MTIAYVMLGAICVLVLYVVIDEFKWQRKVKNSLQEVSQRRSSPHPFRGGVRNDGGESVREGGDMDDPYIPWYCQGTGWEGACVSPRCTCIHAEVGKARRV